MHPSWGYAELETGDTLLAFVGETFVETANLLGEQRYAPSRLETDAASPQIIAFVSEDMEADWQRAVSAGAAIVKKPQAQPWGQTTGYLRDCNGFIVELCTRSPRDVV